MYLTEWLTHHAAEGITQFVLLDQLMRGDAVDLSRARRTRLWTVFCVSK